MSHSSCIFFFNDTATTEIYTDCLTRSLHDARPILNGRDRALAIMAGRRVLVFAIFEANRRREVARMTSLLEEMTRRWPGDASAWAWLALARAMSIDGSDRPAERERRRQVAIRDVHHALTLDPANVLALVAWSWTGRGELFAVEGLRSEEHTSELQSLMRISYAV